MKTLIVYATKYGCTKKCADILKTFLDGNLSKDFHKLPYGKQIIMESKSYFTLFLKIIQGFTFHKIFIYSLSS